MSEDLRQHERIRIRHEELCGTFNLHANEQSFRYLRVHDVSAAGAGIVVAEPLNRGTEVKITFTAGDWAVTVSGHVAWCRRQSLPMGDASISESFRVGIRFDNENPERNLLFFRAAQSTVPVLH